MLTSLICYLWLQQQSIENSKPPEPPPAPPPAAVPAPGAAPEPQPPANLEGGVVQVPTAPASAAPLPPPPSPPPAPALEALEAPAAAPAVSSQQSVRAPGASLLNPALDRLLDFAGEAGLVAIIHNDVDMPFPKPGQDPYQVVQMRDLVKRHPNTTIIWAHAGLGRVVRPVKDQLAIMDRGLANPEFKNLYIDLSWDEVAKYVVASPEAVQATADLIKRYPDRFLFGTDEVAPSDQQKYLKVYDMYAPLFAALPPDVSRKFRMGNYERLFDAARQKVRAWEKAHVPRPAS